LQNLVLDDVKEEGTGESQGRIGRDRSLNALADRISSNHANDVADGRPSRTLGLVVLRGPQITLISPTDGYEGESLDYLLRSFLRSRKSVDGDWKADRLHVLPLPFDRRDLEPFRPSRVRARDKRTIGDTGVVIIGLSVLRHYLYTLTVNDDNIRDQADLDHCETRD
jgi:small nuclear ribonucleoprotein (snRNP)-like protein